jgi:parallel beta-helix repeat protein
MISATIQARAAKLFIVAVASVGLSAAALGEDAQKEAGVPAANAAEYWVSPSGSDDTGTGSPDSPFRTIRKGVKSAKAGDTVFVRKGRYEEYVWVRSGEPDKWFTISAAPGDERQVVVGVETPNVSRGCSASAAFAIKGVKYVRLKGMFCVAAYRSKGAAIAVAKSQHVEIRNCVCTGGGTSGIDANNDNFVTIDGVEAYFNGGGSAWGSGISLFEPQGKDNVLSNNICYGNYDQSPWRSDGNGIIVDVGYQNGGALLVNNVCYMNSGRGISLTKTDNCTLFNNTQVANSWFWPLQNDACEIEVRGNNSLLRNNIGVATHPKAAGMMLLDGYRDGSGKQVKVELGKVTADHNLFYNAGANFFVKILGDESMELSFADAQARIPQWAAGSLSSDPGFVDMLNHDYRLRPDSPALKAGATVAEAAADILGKPRAQDVCSLGAYEGAQTTARAALPTPGVAIAPGENEQAINALLANTYDLDWDGMLYGFGKLLPEELPLQIDVEGPRKADFVTYKGRFVLKDLLDQVAKEHQVRLVLHQPADCRDLPTSPLSISKQLALAEGQSADEQACVRRLLRAGVYTDTEERPKIAFADLIPSLEAALGVKITADKPVPADQKFEMNTANMRLSAVLTDIAGRLGVQFTLARQDLFADAAKVQSLALNQPVGGNNGTSLTGLVLEPQGLVS